MPDEATTQVGTTQTTQDNQSTANQSGNDFVLDFGDIGDSAPATEEVEVDSLSQEEEKADEPSFDINLESDNQNPDELANAENENPTANDVSVEAPEEEPVNDFDLSMDYEGTSEEVAPESEEVVAESEEVAPESEEVVAESEEVAPESEEVVAESEEVVPESEEVVPESEEVVAESEEVVPESEEVAPEDEKIVSEEESLPGDEEIFDEDDIIHDEVLSFTTDDNASEKSESQSDEGHLFHQVNEDNQDEINFDPHNTNDAIESSITDENSADVSSFSGELSNDEISDNTLVEGNEGMSFDIPNESDNLNGLATLDMESPEEKQPELGDLLSNSPIDLSEEMNDTQSSEPDFGNMEASLDGVVAEENNSSLVDEPQKELENVNVEQPIQHEVVDNSTVENVPEEAQNVQQEVQTDERSEAVNNTASQIEENTATAKEINVSTPVELSTVSTKQQEVAPAESENQVQSTLSLDQILDSELLSNPQYADNSKSSPQNVTEKGGKGKAGLFIGVGVAVLACCVAVLAFPSITSERKPGDTVNTGTVVEYPIDDTHSSAPDEPTGIQNPGENPIVVDDPEITDIPTNPNVSGGGGAQVVNLPEDDDSGDGGTGTEPVPYIWSDDGQGDDSKTEDPVVEEIDTNQILNVISSFKTQGEGYYSFAQGSSDTQLMKYSLRLINLCDNYADKVNNGEGVDPESFSSFKSSANKIISKIDTYLGGDEDVPVIREATIDGETNFEGKDEIKEYLYNNR